MGFKLFDTLMSNPALILVLLFLFVIIIIILFKVNDFEKKLTLLEKDIKTINDKIKEYETEKEAEHSIENDIIDKFLKNNKYEVLQSNKKSKDLKELLSNDKVAKLTDPTKEDD